MSLSRVATILLYQEQEHSCTRHSLILFLLDIIMKVNESNIESSGMLPEGLEKFKVLAKFAFDSYHKGESKKVTFFKEDIPELLVHFWFKNEY